MRRAITYVCGVSPVVARNSRWKWNGLIAAASAISCKLGGASNESSISAVTRVSRRASSRPRTRFGARREVADGYVYEQVVDEFVCFEPRQRRCAAGGHSPAGTDAPDDGVVLGLHKPRVIQPIHAKLIAENRTRMLRWS
jgi:hypothetical protein